MKTIQLYMVPKFTLCLRNWNQRESAVENLVDFEDIRMGPYNIWKYIGENHHITNFHLSTMCKSQTAQSYPYV